MGADNIPLPPDGGRGQGMGAEQFPFPRMGKGSGDRG